MGIFHYRNLTSNHHESELITMSHTATVSAEFKDVPALRAACKRLGLPDPVLGEHRLFEDSTRHKGYAVKLNGWTYPVIINTETKQVYYDNYNGRWGDIAKFNEFKQAYATEAAKAQARKMGYRVSEQRQANGAIKLVLAK